METTTEPIRETLENKFESDITLVSNEIRCITQLCLRDDFQTCSEIRKVYSANTRGTWLPDCITFSDHCTELVKAGFADETEVKNGKGSVSKAYRITELGKQIGIPLASAGLEYVLASGKSLHKIFGYSGRDSDNRPAINRSFILEKAYNNKASLVDLAKELDMSPSGTRMNIQKLEAAGLVDFDSMDSAKKGQSSYRWNLGKSPDEASAFRTYPEPTRWITRYLAWCGVADRNEISEATGYHKVTVSKILAFLEREGFCTRVKWRAREHQSEITITEEGRKIVDGLIVPVRKFRASENPSSHEFSADDLSKIVSIYTGSSARMQGKNGSDRKNDIVRFINAYKEQHGEPPYVAAINEGLGLGTEFYLKKMLDEKALSKVKSGRKMLYDIVNVNGAAI